MIPFLISVIVMLLAALVMAIWEQSRASKRGFELGLAEGAHCERERLRIEGITHRRPFHRSPEVTYPHGECVHGVPMADECEQCLHLYSEA